MSYKTPAARVLLLHRLILYATELQLYTLVRVYCTEIINDISLLERSVVEMGV